MQLTSRRLCRINQQPHLATSRPHTLASRGAAGAPQEPAVQGSADTEQGSSP